MVGRALYLVARGCIALGDCVQLGNRNIQNRGHGYM